MPARLVRNAHLPVSFATSLIGGLREHQRFADVETYCMFVGYGRSGHSLVGALLDAHPEAVIAHELDAARYFRAGFRRSQVYWLILRNDREFTRGGAAARIEYTYAVPNQWQGRHRRLRVIGDKKGGRTSRDLRLHPELIERVRREVGVPLRVIHVTRNPYDTIATMWRRKGAEAKLEERVSHYFSLVETVTGLKDRLDPGEIMDVRHEELIRDPGAVLRAIGDFLDLEIDDHYIRDCASILFSSPRPSRQNAPWTPELVAHTQGEIDRFDFLAGYSFES